MIFSKVIIDTKKKSTVRKVDEEDFTTILALITITVTSSSDKHHYVFILILLFSIPVSIIYQFINT